MSLSKVIVMAVEKPKLGSVNESLQWVSKSLGLFGDRDKERSCFRIFIELVKGSQHHRALSSDQLAERARLSRGTVIYHLKRLEASGLISAKGSCYSLRFRSLSVLLRQVEHGIGDLFQDLKAEAEKIDKELRLWP